MKETRSEWATTEVGRLSERIWPQARRAREAALRSRPSTERNEASGQRRRSNRALFCDGRYQGGAVRDEARAVVIGAGICGSSVAYHLTGLGWREVVVLEQGPLHGGTTSHAPGLVGQLRSSVSLT